MFRSDFKKRIVNKKIQSVERCRCTTTQKGAVQIGAEAGEVAVWDCEKLCWEIDSVSADLRIELWDTPASKASTRGNKARIGIVRYLAT